MSVSTTSKLSVPVDSRRDHIRGAKDAPITVVEYGDYECPHCGEAHFIIQQIEEMFADTLRFVFRNFPLSTVHPDAEPAAEAAEAAAAQKKFWPMHDALFENQDALEESDLVRYATVVGLDVPRFVREMNEGRYAPRVREDFLGGARSGVNGTPTFFVNGYRHDGGYDLASLIDSIEDVAEA
jgi:protein-disulfide isomerase